MSRISFNPLNDKHNKNETVSKKLSEEHSTRTTTRKAGMYVQNEAISINHAAAGTENRMQSMCAGRRVYIIHGVADLLHARTVSGIRIASFLWNICGIFVRLSWIVIAESVYN